MQADFDAGFGDDNIVAWTQTGLARPFQGAAARCACHAGPEAFLQMLIEPNAEDGQAWTYPRPLTQSHHWTCAAQALQALSGEAEVSDDPGLAAVQAELADAASVRGSAEDEAPAGLSAQAGLVFVNGRVFTADPEQPWAEAIAIRGEKVLAVGDAASVLEAAGAAARRVDLQGRLVIPGFNDAHMHHTPDPRGVRLPIDPMADLDLEGLGALVRQAVADNRDGVWIFGVMGAGLINEPGLNRLVLDAWAPAHPVILLGFTNHTNVLNSAALSALGIADEAPDPLGGVYQRLPGSRRLSGRIDEYAQWTPQRAFAAMATIPEGVESLRRLSDECVRLGVTSVQNMSWTAPERYLEMLKAAQIPVRVRLIRFPPSGPQGRLLGDGADLPADPGPRITVSGTKWILDGTPVERGAALGRRYADAANTQGRENFSRRDIGEMLRESLDAEDPLLLHAIGPLTLETVICALEDCDAVDWGEKGLRIEHGDGLTQGQMDRVEALGVTVVQNPSHFLLPQFYGPRFGEGAEYAAFADLIERGIPLAIGSDGPLNPFIGLFGAVVHPARPDQASSLEAALVAYTHGGALAEGKGASKGRLVAGFQADLAVLSQDIFTVPPPALLETRSVLTVIAGEVVYQEGDFDSPELK